jgi:hypothetical protein
MTPDTSRAPAIPGYSLDAPGEGDACAALERVFGADRGAERWTQACREAGLVPGLVRKPDAFARVVACLASQGGATASVARSLEIRIRTYARLAGHKTRPAAGARP